MTAVQIVGAQMTSFGRFPDRSPRSLVAEAVTAALDESRIDGSRVGAVYCSNAFGGSIQGQESVRGQVWLGSTPLTGLPMFNIENACAGGGSALALARTAIVAGEIDVAVVAGVEKLTHDDRSKAILAMEGALDQEDLPALRRSLGLDPDKGSPFMRVYAGFAEAYMARSGATQEDFARIASKTHSNGSLNPRAQYRTTMSVEEVLAARTVAGPLTVPMCAPIGDGAAAVVLAADGIVSTEGPVVRLLSSVVGSGRRGEDGVLVPGTARRAFELAGIAPEDVDVLEVHDAASPAELIVLEELGIAGPGEAVGLLRDGQTSLGGQIPVNPSGGLISRGHPLGATGVAQVVELVDQLKERAGDRQVQGARVAAAENAGGYLGPDAAAAAVSVLAR